VVYLRITALYAACISLMSCSGFYFVGFVSNPGGTSTITGIVVVVSDGFASSPNGVTQVTSVAFDNSGASLTKIFCGDQQALFPLSQKVRANYTAGAVCSVLTEVVIINEP